MIRISILAGKRDRMNALGHLGGAAACSSSERCSRARNRLRRRHGVRRPARPADEHVSADDQRYRAVTPDLAADPGSPGRVTPPAGSATSGGAATRRERTAALSGATNATYTTNDGDLWSDRGRGHCSTARPSPRPCNGPPCVTRRRTAGHARLYPASATSTRRSSLPPVRTGRTTTRKLKPSPTRSSGGVRRRRRRRQPSWTIRPPRPGSRGQGMLTGSPMALHGRVRLPWSYDAPAIICRTSAVAQAWEHPHLPLR